MLTTQSLSTQFADDTFDEEKTSSRKNPDNTV